MSTDPIPELLPPIFADPAAHALRRVGIVDVGSNSVRLVVFDGAARSPAWVYNEKVMAGLGKGLAESGHLDPRGRQRALAALRRFSILAHGMGIAPLATIATAALRDATDGADFVAEVARETGLQLNVISGDEEARLSAQGVLLGWPAARGVVCDLGGGSMELARIADGMVGRRVSTPLGPFRLQQVAGGREQRARLIDRVLRKAADTIQPEGQPLYLVGGSWRTIARLDMERRAYPLTVLHEYRMTPADALATTEWLASADRDELRRKIGTSPERMELVPLAAEVLRQLVTVFAPADIGVSAYGIREGLLYEQMPAAIRARDPLIEAAAFAEATQARSPGFGRQLHAFIAPLFADAPPARQRLILTACLLHDTSWRAHPDYRAELCVETTTRANLGGLDHAGRVFLAVALLHRYKNSRKGSRFEPLFALLPPAELRHAEILGKAMRFGAMFALADPAAAARLDWDASARRLSLALTPTGAALFVETAEARFSALAEAMGVKQAVITTPTLPTV